MFRVRDTTYSIEKRIRAFLNDEDCGIAVLLSATAFEWSISRAILSLGTTPTAQLRKKLALCHGLDAYKDLWATEVVPGRTVGRLPAVIQNWATFKKHFKLRHFLIHGRKSCTRSYSEPRVESILLATSHVRAACSAEGVDLHERLRARRKPRQVNG